MAISLMDRWAKSTKVRANSSLTAFCSHNGGSKQMEQAAQAETVVIMENLTTQILLRVMVLLLLQRGEIIII